jgi:putative Holliday junction resolvase
MMLLKFSFPDAPYNYGVKVKSPGSGEASSNHATGRILAIDYGARRMGLAVSDPLGITAQGLPTLERKNKRSDFARLERTLREYEVSEIVLGYPLRMSGEEGTQSQKVREFAETLRQKFQIPVHLWDERLTSAEANRLLREAEVSTRKRAQAVDRMAAVLILQSFLQARASK